MVESLGDARGIVRLGFAEALGEIGRPAVPFLLEALAQHSNVVVRRAAAKTLTLIADPSSIPQLVHSLLNDDDTVVKGSSVGALARMGEASVPVLLEILGTRNLPESTKGHAAWALAFIGAEARDFLYREVNSESAEIRCAVIGAIAKIAQEHQNDQQAFQLLINALNDADDNVRYEAASALGNLSYQPAMPMLIELLQHTDWETRKSAALALMKIGNPSALEPLKSNFAQESEARVRTIFELAIAQLSKASDTQDWK
jgi:bilin biosynthesis protein